MKHSLKLIVFLVYSFITFLVGLSFGFQNGSPTIVEAKIYSVLCNDIESPNPPLIRPGGDYQI